MVCLPVPVRLEILCYIKNTYLSDNIALSESDLVDLVNIFIVGFS